MLLKGKVKYWEQCEDKIQNIFKEKLSLENIDIERADHSKERRAAINQELLFISFCLTSKTRKYLRT